MKKMTGKSKAGIILLVLLLIAAIGAGSIYGISSFAKKNAIGADAAVNFALVDAGVLPEQARVDRVDFEYEHGRFVYEIEFVAEGVDYEYTIQAYTGEVLEKETEPVEGYVAPEKETPAEESSSAPEEPVEESSAPEPQPVSYISVEQAKQTALADAGLSSATFTKAKLEKDDGRVIYEIDFYAGNKEYEYDIDAFSGAILDRDIEVVEAEEEDDEDEDDEDEDEDD